MVNLKAAQRTLVSNFQAERRITDKDMSRLP
jgi:hypothetical protein